MLVVAGHEGWEWEWEWVVRRLLGRTGMGGRGEAGMVWVGERDLEAGVGAENPVEGGCRRGSGEEGRGCLIVAMGGVAMEAEEGEEEVPTELAYLSPNMQPSMYSCINIKAFLADHHSCIIPDEENAGSMMLPTSTIRWADSIVTPFSPSRSQKGKVTSSCQSFELT